MGVFEFAQSAENFPPLNILSVHVMVYLSVLSSLLYLKYNEMSFFFNLDLLLYYFILLFYITYLYLTSYYADKH